MAGASFDRIFQFLAKVLFQKAESYRYDGESDFTIGSRRQCASVFRRFGHRKGGLNFLTHDAVALQSQGYMPNEVQGL